MTTFLDEPFSCGDHQKSEEFDRATEVWLRTSVTLLSASIVLSTIRSCIAAIWEYICSKESDTHKKNLVDSDPVRNENELEALLSSEDHETGENSDDSPKGDTLLTPNSKYVQGIYKSTHAVVGSSSFFILLHSLSTGAYSTGTLALVLTLASGISFIQKQKMLIRNIVLVVYAAGLSKWLPVWYNNAGWSGAMGFVAASQTVLLLGYYSFCVFSINFGRS